jgi:hypothetical protein
VTLGIVNYNERTKREALYESIGKAVCNKELSEIVARMGFGKGE